jgi:AAA domain
MSGPASAVAAAIAGAPRIAKGTPPAAAPLLPMRWPKDYAADVEFEPELVERLLPVRGMGAIVGEFSAGKSAVASAIATAIAAGVDIDGRETLPGAVLFVAAESPPSTELRHRASCLQLGVDIQRLTLPVVQIPVGFASESAERVIANCRETTRTTGQPMRFVVVDTLAANGPGDEREGHMGQVVEFLRHVSEALACFCLVIHHLGKDASKGSRGSSVLPAGLDVVLQVTRTGKDAGRLEVVKMRDGPSGQAMGFKLVHHVLGHRKPNRKGQRHPVTACGIEWTSAPPTAARSSGGRNQQLAVAALTEWARSCQDPAITVPDLTDLLKRQGILHRQRQHEMRTHLVNVGLLVASVGGYTVRREALL